MDISTFLRFKKLDLSYIKAKVGPTHSNNMILYVHSPIFSNFMVRVNVRSLEKLIYCIMYVKIDTLHDL